MKKILILLAILILNGFTTEKEKYRVVAKKNTESGVNSVSNETEVIDAMIVYIPNAFTPNGDGINDTWGVTGQGISDMELYVYNRWGELVFVSTEPTQKWGGEFNGEPVQAGVYVYKLKAFSEHYGKYLFNDGSVTIIR